MKLIIAGSRDLNPNISEIENAFLKFNLSSVTEIVSGRARGVDTQGEIFASKKNFAVKLFPADWDRHGKAAGPIRNKQMADYADALLLIWDGKSSGSANMKRQMQALGKPVFEVVIKKRPWER